MILDRELDLPSAPRDLASRGANETPCSRGLSNGLVFLLLFSVVLILQVASGAYHAEFNGYPDESAHYVTSLMVRQYITSLHPGAPVPFAQDYYAHYPKVAFGHWPPLLYVVQGIWMSLFSPARASVLLELAFTTALLAYSVFSQARRWLAHTGSYRTLIGLFASILLICIPLVQTYTDEEMSETLLALTCFWSAIYFTRYLESQNWKDNGLFGVFFALAVLTKGSGWLLTLVPPIALLLTRKLRLLFKPSFWFAPLIVGATCIPWQLMTMHLVEEGWEGGSNPTGHYTFSALAGFAALFLQIVGPVLLLFAVLGIFVTIFLPLFRRGVRATAAVMFALILADWFFHSLVPAGVEDRKLIIALPALVLFVISGALWVADRLPVSPKLQKWRLAGLAAIIAVVFAARTFTIPHEKHQGYIEAARYIESVPALRNATILVSSGSAGEGPFIAEIAMCQPRPVNVILRGTKVLAHVSFDADVYQQLFPDPPSVFDYLRQRGVQLVVLDSFSPRLGFAHDAFLRQLVRDPKRFSLLATYPSGSSPTTGQVQLYRPQYTY